MDSQYLKTLDSSLSAIVQKLREELQTVRGNRPSLELVENIKVNCYDQWFTIKQVGSLSVLPPRGVQINVWDKNAVGAVIKAIEGAKIGLSASNDGNIIRAILSPLGEERREELTKLVKKSAEASRIQIRHHRDESIKKIKAAESGGELNEDQVFKTKEEIQKLVDKYNDEVEKALEAKLEELNE